MQVGFAWIGLGLFVVLAAFACDPGRFSGVCG